MSRLSNPRPVPELAKSKKKHRSRTGRIRVLMADDHTMFLTGVRSLIELERDMTVVAQGTDRRHAVELWRKHRPDVTLVDLRMPVLDGVGVIREIRREDP